MTNEQAIIILNSLRQYYNDKNEDSYVGFDDEDNEAIETAIKALEQISHLTDRPCSVCEFHKEDGCSKWECVFEGSDSE